MDRKITIHKHKTWTEKVTCTNTKHGQKKYHTRTLDMDRKLPCTNTKHGQKKYHTQTLNMDRNSNIHKH